MKIDWNLRFWTGLVLLMSSLPSWANKITHYAGEAKQEGKLVYLEKHDVEYDGSGQLLFATTLYQDPNGKPLAKLKSDFTVSLTIPNHSLEDFRSGNIEGLRREGGSIVLFDKDKGKPERTKIIEEKKDDDHILVGCQGLNYYLLGNLDLVKPGKKVPVRFLIPGKLDYYDFDLEFKNEKPQDVLNFEVTIQNLFLKIFAPKLYVQYDKTQKHLISYRGLSNITNEHGKIQNVTIDYRYPEHD